MKKIILLFTLCCLPKLMAQQAVLSSGKNVIGTGGSVSYSVGQIVYKSTIGSNGNVNQGVEQPFEIFPLGNNDFPEITLAMTVYPNPTASFLNLKIHSLSTLNMDFVSYQLNDIRGKLLYSQRINALETQIQMQDLAPAVYLLNVYGNNKLLKTFKIIKN